ncbi:hypothetical protein BDY19DRAFT_879813 [Irpex rosettiformis]|uniref:Uncharacterized protein n=1 Tax=Irpex rosettiformis TaxID=378272 RepID=A0ACB8UN27_9APHY|nr:hypothetical protein BDY19DRAFT_879813 [Irpex rosettiformis]
MPSPHDRIPITPALQLTEVLPVYLCYYLMAVLTVQSNTLQYKLALLPVGLVLAFRAATKYDMAAGNPDQKFQNFGHCLGMTTVTMRIVIWTFLTKPLQRTKPSGSVYRDALNLMCNSRGVGWNWGMKPSHFPIETRPTYSKRAFLYATVLRLIKIIFLYDAFNYTVRACAPSGVGTPSGGSIFDPTLPPFQRYALSSFIAVTYCAVFYYAIEMAYYFATVVGLLIPGLDQQPSDWPTLSQSPWLSTSLADYWGRRWHQGNRDMFTSLSYPFKILFGRAGLVLGAFFWSAVLHDLGIWGLGAGTNFSQTGGFFLLMGVGVLVETHWAKITGKEVGGIFGWVWTMAWMVLGGNILVDGWMKTGLGGGEVLPPAAQPVTLLMRYFAPAVSI